MIRRVFPLLLSVAATVAVALAVRPAHAAPENPSVRNFPLDEYSVQTVPVSRDTVTTVSFPGPITAIQGSRFTTGGGRLDLFQVDYNKGSYFLSLRALQHGGRANLNVVWNHKTYVLDVVDSAEPVLSAIFVVGGANNSKRPAPPAAVSPNRLLGMMDKVKSYPLLVANYPQSVADVEVAQPGTPTDYPQFVVTVDEVYRFPQADTLVFKLTFKNKTAETVYYAPNLLGIRAGDLVFTNAISDASGTIPPNGSEPAYLAITGTPTGGRNDLSVKNPFYVVVSAPENAAPSLFPARTATTTTVTSTVDSKTVVAPTSPARRK